MDAKYQWWCNNGQQGIFIKDVNVEKIGLAIQERAEKEHSLKCTCGAKVSVVRL